MDKNNLKIKLFLGKAHKMTLSFVFIQIIMFFVEINENSTNFVKCCKNGKLLV